jgi:exodeoxyribonuclease VIII
MTAHPVRIMVDIETLGVTPDAHILSIGAVMRDKELRDSFAPFYSPIEPISQRNRKIDYSTVAFWRGQTNFPEPTTSAILYDVLNTFHGWCETVAMHCGVSREDIEFWCKGTDFDFVILSNAYAEAGWKVPWKYNMVRDLRTLAKVFPQINPPENHNEHYALEDARVQMQHLVNILCIINSSPTN